MPNYEIKYSGGGRRVVGAGQFYLLGGVLTLLASIFIVAAIGQKTKEFDFLVAKKIERVHRQIAAERYGEIYTEAGRGLIAEFDQAEFEARLRAARPTIAGKLEKRCTSEYPDIVQRVRRNLSTSFRFSTVCRLENESHKSVQYFDWRIRGEEIDLIWFESRESR